MLLQPYLCWGIFFRASCCIQEVKLWRHHAAVTAIGSADEAEALKLLRRTQEDEAMARKMQAMMDEEGARERLQQTKAEEDAEIARLLQVSTLAAEICQ